VEPLNRSAKPAVIAAITVFVVAAGCTSSDQHSAPTEQREVASADTTTTAPCLWGGGVEANDYVGLGESDARERAETSGVVLRIQGGDDGCIGGNDDLRSDRVNVVILGGRVVAARRY
jgi:hypothetical protein